MDYYKTLGLDKSASQEQIKTAYKKLAKETHPDRNGGDDIRFKQINEAYQTLGDQKKREEYDMVKEGGYFTQGGEGFDMFKDFFSDFEFAFGPGGFQQRRTYTRKPPRNKNLNVNVNITLEEAFSGLKKEIVVRTLTGEREFVSVEIPCGVDSGQQIKFDGLGDNSNTGAPRGNLFVTINVIPHPDFERARQHLLHDVTINSFEAIIGCEQHVTTMEGKTIKYKIPPGTNSGTKIMLRGQGMPLLKQSYARGDLFIRVNVKTPHNITQEQIDTIRGWLK